jgi:tRNA-specific 2-thiouridylase
MITLSLAVEGSVVTGAGFEASGCGAMVAAGSAAVALVSGAPVLDAARVGTAAIAAELGGLSPGKLHAAELAADALHRALGLAARADAVLPHDPSRALVAMSGGVDSAVAGLLTEGEPVAVTLELWADAENDAEASCCSAHAVRVARALAHGMEMPHFTLDLRSEFRAGVVEPWLAGHAAGETPNPCVGCNGHVRLDAMLEFADALGCAVLATGHYARVSEDGLLRSAADPAKDQAYMLCALSPATLARMRFPLGELTKPEVRALAAEADLPVASKADSQDLCFLAGTGRAAFLARHGGAHERPGEIVDRGGRVLGRHRGHHGFTVGQRKGIGVAAPEPLYVLATDARTNRVTVGARAELATREVAVRGAMLHRPGDQVDSVRLRYRSKPLPCTVAEEGRGRLTLHLGEPCDGAAPGQTACLYAGDVVVGYGTIAG